MRGEKDNSDDQVRDLKCELNGLHSNFKELQESSTKSLEELERVSHFNLNLHYPCVSGYNYYYIYNSRINVHALLTFKVPISCMPNMTSLAAAVAPHAGKIIKNVLRVFERAENFLSKMVYHTLYLG